MAVNGFEQEDRALAVICAQRFFVDDRSKVEIAEELGMSRFKVARLIALARDTGLVSITINGDAPRGDDLAHRLQDRFALHDVTVLPERAALNGLGQAGADMVGRYVRPGDLLGVGWGRAVDAVVSAFTSAPQGGIDVVQLAGGIAGSTPALDPGGVAARAAATLGGRLTPLHGPAFLKSEATRRALLSEPGIAAAAVAFSRIRLAVVGIGALGSEPDSALVVNDALPAKARAELTRLGAVADVVCHFFDADGRAVDAWEKRTLAVPVEQLRAADVCLGVAAGRSKAVAVLAALRSGVVTALVTDAACAAAVLEAAGPA